MSAQLDGTTFVLPVRLGSPLPPLRLRFRAHRSLLGTSRPYCRPGRAGPGEPDEAQVRPDGRRWNRVERSGI